MKLLIIIGAVVVMIILAGALMTGAYTIAVIFGDWLCRARRKRLFRLWPFQNMKLSYLEKYEWRRFHYANVIHDSNGEILEIQRFESWFWARVELMEPR